MMVIEIMLLPAESCVVCCNLLCYK